MKSPHPRMVKKLNFNFLIDRKSSMVSTENMKGFDPDQERFDDEAATTMMQSKHTLSKLNSLFLDTKIFNMTKPEYMPELSMPGSLEKIDSLQESPFMTSKKQNTNFSQIRKHHRQLS